MAIKIKGFGRKRDLNDIRDYTPETESVKNILTSQQNFKYTTNTGDNNTQLNIKAQISKGAIPPQ